jgi:IS5 family transposase
MKEKPDIIDIIEKKRLQWYGHVKRMQEEKLLKLIMEWIPGERRKSGRPRKSGWKVYEQPWKQYI